MKFLKIAISTNNKNKDVFFIVKDDEGEELLVQSLAIDGEVVEDVFYEDDNVFKELQKGNFDILKNYSVAGTL